MGKRNRIITVTIILVVIIGVIVSLLLYKNINNTKQLENFKQYIETYKTEINNYIVTQHKDKYDEVLIQAELIITNKDVEKIATIKQQSVMVKDEIYKTNLELINTIITELETMELSKLNDKDAIKEKIDQIKIDRDDSNFAKANELALNLKDNINKKLEEIKHEEEKKKAEEEKRKAEEEKKSIEEYKLIENNNFTKREALEYIENEVVSAYFTDKMTLKEYDNGDFEYIPNDPINNNAVGVYFTKISPSIYEFRIKSIIISNGMRDSMTQESGIVHSDGSIEYY